MATYLFGCLVALSIGIAGSASAQRAAAPGLTALALPAQKAEQATATSTPAATAPAATVAAPLFKPDSIFINPEVRPQFTGGDAAFRAYLAKNLRYPAEAARQHLTGKVSVNFVLSATGLVTYATVLRGPSKVLNDEALRLVWHMPAWQPARQHGQPVRVSCTIPIVFVE